MTAIREEVHRISPDVPVSGVRTMDQAVASQLAQPRFSSLLLGAFAGLALSRVLRSLLYEVSAHDFVIFAGVALLVGAVSLVASSIPTRQATRVDPLVALRYE